MSPRKLPYEEPYELGDVAQSQCQTYLVSGPRELRKRYRNGHVDADLADFDLAFEFPSSRAGLGEYGSTVTVLVGVDDR